VRSWPARCPGMGNEVKRLASRTIHISLELHKALGAFYRVERRTDDADRGTGRIEAFLQSLVKETPGLRFQAIVQAARQAFNISRATAATHLARLVRFGEITRLPDHSYVAGAPPGAMVRATAEVRWYESIVIIRQDGSARLLTQRELRVLSGQLDHVEFIEPKPPRRIAWWCSIPGRLSVIPASRSVTRLPTHRIDFEAPLTSRDGGWLKVCRNLDLPPRYRMAYDPGVRNRGPADSRESRYESESVEILSEGRRFGNRLSADAQLRLQVIFPSAYPVGRARSRVRFLTEWDHLDSNEQERLESLSRDELHQDGLRRTGDSLTLSVPHPVLDRHYEIEWGLPTNARRRAWLTARARRSS
jgi:hypothetical protein